MPTEPCVSHTNIAICSLSLSRAFDDYIEGNEGQDVILGDFGLWREGVEFLLNHFYESIIDDFEYAGSDEIHGGPGDDILLGKCYVSFSPSRLLNGWD